MKVKCKKLDKRATIPEFKSDDAAGMDITASGYCWLPPKTVVAVPTGLSVEIPKGYELQVRPRSGLAMNGTTVFNAPGTIDADYRGEIKVLLYSICMNGVEIGPGDRIAQLVMNRLPKVEIEEVEELSETKRGEGGFGSTGK